MIQTVRTSLQTARWAIRRLGPADRSACGYIGGHGGNNLGDNLMIDVAAALFPQWRLVEVAESWHEKRLARVGCSGARYFEHILLGGGTLISPFWFGKVQTAVSQGVPISSLGTGAGSCGFIQREDVDLSQWAPLLRRFRHLGVRGPRSQQRLQAIGVEHAEVVGDLALYLTVDEAAPPAGRPVVALNLSLPTDDEPGYSERERFAELVEGLRPLVRKGWEVRPYAMNMIDIEPTRHVLIALGLEDVPVPHLKTVGEFFDRHRDVTLNVAVRLHGAILGCCMGVAPLILGYRDKCLDFADSMDLADLAVSLTSARPGEIRDRLGYAVDVAERKRPEIVGRGLAYKRKLEEYAARVARGVEAAA